MKPFTELSLEKWRVTRMLVPRAVAARGVPDWHRPSATVSVAVWAVWPPHWGLEGSPLLIFPMWRMAFRAAFDRAQFSVSPTPPDATLEERFYGKA
jgi:hypothetical protein